MQTINWLKPKIDFDKVPVSVSMVITLFLLGALLYWPVRTLLLPGLIFIALLAFFVLILRRDWGLYWIVGLCFFYGWEISFSKYSWAQNLSFLSETNAPLGDFIGVVVLAYFLILLLLGLRRLPSDWLARSRRPLICYGLFLAWALLAVLFAYEHNNLASFKYWLRFPVFALVFWLLPVWLADKKENIAKIFEIWFWVGVVVALFGLSSILVVNFSAWTQVTPYGIGSFAPLGRNHNMIGQALVAIIPIAWLLARYASNEWERKIKIGGTAIMIAAALLTLSRATWLCLALEGGIALWFYRQEIGKLWLKYRQWLWGGALLSLVVIYMVSFLGSATVRDSNISRWEGVRLALLYLTRSPVIGYGPGAYLTIADRVEILRIEYGDALEAHGWIQKIAVEEGVVGIILFALFLFFIFWELFSWCKKISARQRDLAVAVLAMAAGAVLFQFFNPLYFTSVMWVPLGVAYAALRNFDEQL